jgi:DNA-binding HxlR family transcriptional regulator
MAKTLNNLNTGPTLRTHTFATRSSLHSEPLAPGVYCPVFQHVMELLGRRWTGVIIRELLNGPARFSDLRRAIPGLTDRLLADRLDELEHEHLVHRSIEDEVVTYRLTERGEDLRTSINAITLHASKWATDCQLADRPGRKA